MRNTYFIENPLLKCVILLSSFITVTLAHTTPLYIKKVISKNQIAKQSHRKPGQHHRVDAEEALRMLREQNPYNQPCIPDFVKDHDASRIPEDLPHMPCPKGTGNRCVEIQLPMHVSFYSPKSDEFGNYHQDKLESKIIHVPSGCYENKKSHHPLKALTPKPTKEELRNKATSKHN